MNAPRVAAAEERSLEARLVRLKDRMRRSARGALHPLIGGLARLGVRPDHLTVAGCVLSLGAGLAFFVGAFRWGAALVALGGLCDILDGQLAAELGLESRAGAFLDSTLDRLGEAGILVGIAGFYVVHLAELVHEREILVGELERGLEPVVWARVALVAVLALVGSFLVSYTRARAEGLGLECRVGWFERPERLALLTVGGAFGVGRVMSAALLLLTVLSFATAAQRVAYVWRITRLPGADAPGGRPSDR